MGRQDRYFPLCHVWWIPYVHCAARGGKFPVCSWPEFLSRPGDPVIDLCSGQETPHLENKKEMARHHGCLCMSDPGHGIGLLVESQQPDISLSTGKHEGRLCRGNQAQLPGTKVPG